MKNFKVYSKMISEAWKIDKTYFIYLFLSIIFQTCLSLALIYYSAYIVSMISNRIELNIFLRNLALASLGIYALKQIVAGLQKVIEDKQEYQNMMLGSALSEKTISLSFKELENPESLDLLERAKMPVSWGILYVGLGATKNLLVAVFTIVGLLSILFVYSWIYALVVLVIVIVISLLRIKFQAARDEELQKNAPINRKYGYYLNEALGDVQQKEFRVFNIHKIWLKQIIKFNKVVTDWIIEIEKRSTNISIFEGFATALISFISISYNAIRLLSNALGPRINIGQFTLIFNSTNNLVQNMDVISRSLSTLNTVVSNLTPWAQYLDLEDQIMEGNREAQALETLEFKNVFFTYPNTDKLILDDISFKINKGEKISIVGLNNAGKTTIVKLISRFYSPDKGQILWNGRDIKEYEIRSYTDQVSAVFQDFKLMPYSIYENLVPEKDSREEAIESLKQVNMYEEVSKLPKGIDTFLDKQLEEDASNFSGGQSQKLAIARAINKGGSLMMLDEPTAALDPIAESEIFEKFAELTEGKTSIFISHRMSSSTFSDKVLLLDDGKIAGFASHKELMKGHNLYRDLFETQAKNYV